MENSNVASRNVGPVLKEVASLCGRIPNKLTARSLVDNFNDSKVMISQKHPSGVAAKKSETTLYTDETRKYGHTNQTYLISDQDGNFYILGVRKMVNKSGQCTLDTLKNLFFLWSGRRGQGNVGVGRRLLANKVESLY